MYGKHVNGAPKSVSDDARCVACHVDASKLAAASAVQLEQYKYRSSEGITCVECHGAAIDWVTEHGLPTREWRYFSRGRKENEFGMKDLWNPFTRIKLCLSCHLGDASNGRFVTHEMYAAGHPPLPSIQVPNFSEAIPRHWEYLGEKFKNINLGKDDKDIKEMLGISPDRLERTELIAAGGLLTLKIALEQFVFRGSVQGKQLAQADYGRYDCYACHHELQIADRSWRQARGTDEPPGRPRAATWPASLAVLSIVAANPMLARKREDEFRLKMRAFHAAVAAQPFRNEAAVINAVTSFNDWAAPIIKELEILTEPPARFRQQPAAHRQIIDRTTALEMLRRLCALATEQTPDYESARQMAWACRTIYEELTPKDDAIPDELVQLDKLLVLTLHADATRPESYPTKQNADAIVEGQHFVARLKAVADYDPSSVKKLFEVLAKHLPAK
jgi:hypothetical protein